MKLKDKKIKADDYVSKLQMKCLYWDRLREKLDTNKEPGYNERERLFLLKVLNVLTWSFKYGKHKDKYTYVTLEIRSSKFKVDRKFTTKGLVSVKSIFRDYDAIHEVKTKVRYFFDALIKVFRQVVSYCQVNDLDVDDFDTLVYDKDIVFNIDSFYSICNLLNIGKYSAQLMSVDDDLTRSIYGPFDLDAPKNTIGKSVKMSYEGKTSVYYIYEK